jgi:hypothetical protein
MRNYGLVKDPAEPAQQILRGKIILQTRFLFSISIYVFLVISSFLLYNQGFSKSLFTFIP